MKFMSYQFLFVTLILVFNAVPEGKTQVSSSHCFLANSTGLCVSADMCSDRESLSSCSAGQVCCIYSHIQIATSLSTTTNPLDLEPVDTGNEVCGRRHPNGIHLRTLEFTFFAEFPWTVAVLSNKLEDNNEWNEDTLQGGGSLIGPRAVLTAAHIVKDFQGVPLKVRAGEGHNERMDMVDYLESSVQAIIIHENYDNETIANDIALLILEKPIETNFHIGFACLPEQGQKAPLADECYATGWGKDTVDGTLQNNMKKIKLPIVERRECVRTLRQSRLGPFYMLPRSVICAGGVTKEDTCLGDGGAPLVCPIPETEFYYKQYGIVSWGVDCGDGNPGGYTDVAAFRHWIDNKMKDNGLPTSTYDYSA